MPKRIIILGSTGSIGRNALRVVDERQGEFKVVGLAGLDETGLLLAQVKKHSPVAAALAIDKGGRAARALARAKTRLFTGADSARRLVEAAAAERCLVAISGAAALEPALAAVKRGMDVALASKEVLVMAGELTKAAVRRAGVKLVPVDSEHSAIFQCLAGVKRAEVARLWLTASGGPFLGWPQAKLKRVTAKQALAHPTWDMGPKITIDSATMMNKGLEVIEAHYLFGLPLEKISVVIHPQSLVHSMVELCDGSLLALLSEPDMRIPIQYGLSYPARLERERPRLRLDRERRLEFLPLPKKGFPCLALAYAALRRGGAAPAVLNAANEVAVAAFLAGGLDFPGIARVNGTVLRRLGGLPGGSLAAIKTADAEARAAARRAIG